jgi:hypothetical protein
MKGLLCRFFNTLGLGSIDDLLLLSDTFMPDATAQEKSILHRELDIIWLSANKTKFQFYLLAIT